MRAHHDGYRRYAARRAVASLVAGLVLAALGLMLLPTQSALAATVTVTRAGDPVDPNAPLPTGDGVALREAILSINQGPNYNRDVVAAGDPYGTNDAI